MTAFGCLPEEADKNAGYRAQNSYLGRNPNVHPMIIATPAANWRVICGDLTLGFAVVAVVAVRKSDMKTTANHSGFIFMTDGPNTNRPGCVKPPAANERLHQDFWGILGLRLGGSGKGT